MADNSLHEHHLFVFGPFRLDAAQRLLFRGGEVVPLEPKVFETLLALVEAAGRALTKDELLARVWRDAFVEEGSLTRNISTLRKALASDDNPQGYIDTLPRRGYRFQPVVARGSAARVQPATAPPTAPPAAPLTAAPATARSAAPDPAPGTVRAPAPIPVVVRPPEAPAGASRFRWLIIAAGTVAALLVVAAAGAWWRSGDERARITSIAVLPLQNLSGDASQEFFSDGMTEALISRLAQVSDVRVTSRTSVMRFKGASTPVPEIGRQLDVDAVVEGSVQRDGGRVRVTVQLIHAASDSHLWAKEFDGTLEDVLDLQRRIALAIAGDISSKIAPVDPTGAPERRLAAEAVDAYLLGRYLFWKTDSASKRGRSTSCARPLRSSRNTLMPRPPSPWRSSISPDDAPSLARRFRSPGRQWHSTTTLPRRTPRSPRRRSTRGTGKARSGSSSGRSRSIQTARTPACTTAAAASDKLTLRLTSRDCVAAGSLRASSRTRATRALPSRSTADRRRRCVPARG
jgi:TolB-like protein/DNA-binding winged helix-turn-helix (wHTH) protein